MAMNCVCVAVWPTAAAAPEAGCQRCCRDTGQQISLSELQPPPEDARSTDDGRNNSGSDCFGVGRRASSPRVIKSEHLSPLMTSSISCDRSDRVVTSSHSVTSRGTSPLDMALQDPFRDVVRSPESLKPDHPPSSSQRRCDDNADDATAGRTGSDRAAPAMCLSSLGYRIECITPVDDEPSPDQQQSAEVGEISSKLDDRVDEAVLTGLDVLSCVASSQVRETCAAPTTTTTRQRFSILDLPLSQFIDAATAAAAASDGDGDGDRRISSSSPDVIAAGYNVPMAGDCVVSSESLTRVIQQQNAAAGGSDMTAEQRPGDVFAALKVDVGQYCCLLFLSYIRLMNFDKTPS